MTRPQGLFRQFPRAVQLLLALSLLRAVSFFALLPFLPIYLHDVLTMGAEGIGYTLGLSMLGGTLMSVYGGYLADKFDKLRFMVGLNALIGVLYLAFLPLHWAFPIIVVLLLVNTGASSLNVVGNALLSEYLPQETRAKAFSLRYALQNIGAAIGPFLGAWLVRYDQDAPFIIAAVLTFLTSGMLLAFRGAFRASAIDAPPPEAPIGFGQSLKAMRGDRRLVLFTLGGICSMVVYGPLLTYLAQYLIVVKSAAIAYETVAWVSAANAAVVISLQYIVGTWIKEEKLLQWVTLGSAAFILGLLGLSMSTEMGVWVAAIVVFTLGEIIIAPAEFMFIDMIAPKNLRGIYFGAQNMVYIGVTIGPILCGFLLKHAPSSAVFYAMMGMAALGWLFYYAGCRRAAT